MKIVSLISLLLIIVSCTETRRDRVSNLIHTWSGHLIHLPENNNFILFNDSTASYNTEPKYTIISYMDSMGCVSCKLKLSEWMNMKKELDSMSNNSVDFRFVFHPKNKNDLVELLKRNKFSCPVYIDEQDSFNLKNRLPDDFHFHTFLLDKAHRIIAMGNPIYNPRVKKLFINAISEKNMGVQSTSLTTIKLEQRVIDLKTFPWKKKQERKLSIQNTGKVPLAINDVITSCGCTIVNYDKAPILPNKNASFHICYQAEHPEYFNKTISIYCNTASSPIVIKIKGSAVK